MELQDFDHEHPLIFSKEVFSACEECGIFIQVGDPAYFCFPCKFFLHKSCAKKTNKIRIMVHPAHPLHKQESVKDNHICEICNESIFGSGYHCPLCDIYIDYGCALRYTFKPHSHKHKFIAIKPTSFTCDVCGEEESECISYICKTCQIRVHKTCSDKFPYTVKQMGHPHQLTLTYSYQRPHDFVSKPCKICYRQIKKELCFYHCSEDCDYYAHIKCATSKHLKDDGNSLSSREGNQLTVEGKLKHFSHEHCLILGNDDPKSDEICFGCGRPMISSSPVYSCVDDQCNFLLHQQCAELSNKILHPLHVHPLTIAEKYPFDYFGMFQCCGCNVSCSGFTYMCSDCDDFFLCVACILFSDTLKHEGHPCTLSLISKGDETECSACGVDCSTKFRCEKCNFSIDLRCASLPNTTSGKCPNHEGDKCLFKLSFSPEDESDEYYCDLCEERRGKYHWFYYCEECGKPFHPQCGIVDKYMYTFGKTYQLKSHLHPFTFVKNVEAKGSPLNCVNCDDPCKDMPILVCVKCDIYNHPWHQCRLPKDPLHHFSHQHDLILSDGESWNLCDGCVRPLHPEFPYYTCVDQCNFFLHKECAALPNEVLHPLHVHPLNLAIQNPLDYCGKFQCQGCDVTCNGFTYMCFQCNFFLDVGCALLSDTIEHEGHKCPLSLIPKCDETECNACGLNCSTKFRCETCNFDLDLRCASLPKIICCPNHRSEDYTLKLTYSSHEDASENYKVHYCHACKTPGSHMFYYCENCDYSSHPQCLLGEDLIKSGKTYRFICHPHSLTLVRRVEDCESYLRCEICMGNCRDMYLVCNECKLYFHYRDKCASIVD